MENQDTNSSVASTSLWLLAILLVGILCFFIGKNTATAPIQESDAPQPNVLSGNTANPTVTPTPSTDLVATCAKTGASEKKEYLKSYILKEGDTINSIAKSELGDTTRNTEILTLNDNISKMTVGSILYLPPDFIKSSSGHIAQISGKIVQKDEGSWQISYGGGEKGPGLWMPGFWFKDLPGKDNYKIGDCVTILFDNGVKVYTVTKN